MPKETKEMSFIDHLEDLRWMLFRSFVSIFIFGLIAFLNKSFIFDTLLFGPTKPDFFTYDILCKLGEKMNAPEVCISAFNFEIVNLDMAGQFMTHLSTSIALGFILSFPYVVWEIWRFVKPGLHDVELKASRSVLFSSGVLFFIGVLFGYYLLVPFGVNFMATYQVSDTIKNTFGLSNYISFVSMSVLFSGIMFELPVAVFLLAKIGIVNAAMMREYRKHAVVVIFIVAAVITPADVGTMIIVAVPIWILYEISIFVAAAVSKTKLNKQIEI